MWKVILTLALMQLCLVCAKPSGKLTEGKHECRMGQADVLFILDESTSIWEENYQRQLEFVNKMIRSYDIGPNRVRIGIISFASRAITRFDMNKYNTTDEMTSAVSKFNQLYGDTHTWEAMALARNSALTTAKGSRKGKVPQIGIVITDGNSQIPWETKAEAARTRRVTGIKLYAIGIGARISKQELYNIAGSKDRVITVTDYAQLLDEQVTILDEACMADQGKCGGRNGVDCVFLMDTPNAGSIDIVEANEFMRVVTKELDVGADKVRVASVPSRCNGLVSFDLKTHSTKDQVLNALQVESKSKSAGLPVLLEKTLSHTFSTGAGGRPKAKKVVVLVTDGKPGDADALARESDRLKAQNVEVFAIGVGPAIAVHVLENLATDKKHVQLVPDYESLRKIKDILVSGICQKTTAPPTYINRKNTDSGRLKLSINSAVRHFVSVSRSERPARRRIHFHSSSKRLSPNTWISRTIVMWRFLVILTAFLGILFTVSAQLDVEALKQPRSDCRMGKVDVLFILDESTSILPEDYDRQLTFVNKMIKSYLIGPDRSRIGIISFATRAITRFDMNDYSTADEMTSAVSKFKQLYGDTHTWEAMALARNSALTTAKGSRKGKVPQIGIVITDGNSQIPWKTKTESAKTREETGITLFAIGIGDFVSEIELVDITGSKDRVMTSKDYAQLVDHQQSIFKKACVPDSGKCGEVDCAFVMDTPNADATDIIEANEFMRVVTKELDVGDKKVRMASVPSRCTTLAAFDLNSHETKDQVLDALLVESTAKSGRLPVLLEETLAKTFSSESGARSAARKIIILVTDGKPVDLDALKRESDRLRALNVEIFVIGVGKKIDVEILTGLATDRSHVMLVPDYESLRKLKDKLVSGVCYRTLMRSDTETRQKRIMDALQELVDEAEEIDREKSSME
ncbi:collagen alpha-6(VI) chain-like [Tubulanus polymorphus]|uniref:collagen alpha-6(VI) chain-like n=1 Tax=Tubulanus polymorphus TaxID=672921 RepID=UPI003DA5DAB9